ncbi:MAG: type II toxin-antitoxin system RelE/ParE family toxin [Desulfovibrio sp.]|nr:type II toxin-antitoxin system RelE/ParE family toxin [Desulfovibrio sp.]
MRTQSGGTPLRVLYAFDPRRVALLLIGGDKTGRDDWYERYVPLADRLYDEHLKEISEE